MYPDTKKSCLSSESRFNDSAIVSMIQNMRLVDPRVVSLGAEKKRVQSSEQLLIQKVIAGQTKQVQRMLDAGVNSNSCDENAVTVLAHAVKAKNKPMVRLLLSVLKTDANVQDKQGVTPLMEAAISGDESIIQLLLSANVQINTAGKHGQTALQLAAGIGHLRAVLLLLGAGARVKTVDNAGDTPLICAMANGHIQIAQLLLVMGADAGLRDAQGRTAVDYATQWVYQDGAYVRKAS